jgi:4'-phosphopantetheinyl transferase EntD
MNFYRSKFMLSVIIMTLKSSFINSFNFYHRYQSVRIPRVRFSSFSLNEIPCQKDSFEVLENSQTSHGHCMILKCPGELTLSDLDASRNSFPEITNEEVLYLKHMNCSLKRNSLFTGSRIAMKRTIPFQNHLNSKDTEILQSSILKDSFGAPVLPNGIIGSISHKDDLVVVIARSLSQLSSCDHTKSAILENIGIDIELKNYRSAMKIQNHVLTENELKSLNDLPRPLEDVLTVEEEIMLRFSIKESIYKALNPLLRRFIGFHAVEVYPSLDGKAELLFTLKPDPSSAIFDPSRLEYSVIWKEFLGKYFITAVNVRFGNNESRKKKIQFG